ncbi:hypothetical protein JAU75_17145 [Ochrobactrum sp. Q0168]|uniref:hypothetical protein n=1 Tax=Ochrobactrum sp. Q0168 TaxID=2793241 RepID=UPI0018EDD424|nr:hypothetical protein [Ochrobactrum sp. Q0168]
MALGSVDLALIWSGVQRSAIEHIPKGGKGFSDKICVKEGFCTWQKVSSFHHARAPFVYCLDLRRFLPLCTVQMPL